MHPSMTIKVPAKYLHCLPPVTPVPQARVVAPPPVNPMEETWVPGPQRMPTREEFEAYYEAPEPRAPRPSGGPKRVPSELKKVVLEHSVADNWEEACLEWAWINSTDAEEFQTCVCLHYPIRELCTIHNRLNENTLTVGNCCVRQFDQFDDMPALPFTGFRRIMIDADAALNESAIKYAFSHRWITDWEHEFLMDTRRKRNLSWAQEETRSRINQKVLRKL